MVRRSKTKSKPQPTAPNGENSGVHSETGVDTTLIRWMLSLTPEERLDWLCDTIRSVEEVRRGRSK